jgi:hypothetical protein
VSKIRFANPNNKTIIMLALINFPTDFDENHRLAPVDVVRVRNLLGDSVFLS